MRGLCAQHSANVMHKLCLDIASEANARAQDWKHSRGSVKGKLVGGQNWVYWLFGVFSPVCSVLGAKSDPVRDHYTSR